MQKQLTISALLLTSFILHASLDPKKPLDPKENITQTQQDPSNALIRHVERQVEAALSGALIARIQEQIQACFTTAPQEVGGIARLLGRSRDEQLAYFRQQFVQQHPQATPQEIAEHMTQIGQSIPVQATAHLRQQMYPHRQHTPPAT